MTSLNEKIATNDGHTFGAYVSRPNNPNGNAIVLLQEIFGVTSTIRRVADRYAQDGYVVYAPDLFWRLEPGIELSHSREDIQRAMSLMGQFDEQAGLSDIAQTVEHIRELPGFQGKVAVAGLCMGGRLSYLASARLNIDAAVAYYGVGIERNIDEAGKLQCPIILHFGKNDDYVPLPAQEAIAAGLADSEHAAVYFYDDTGHGFYTRGDPATIKTAHERTEKFLQLALSANKT